MLVSNRADFEDATPIPYVESLNWTLAPDGPAGYAYVFVRFIDGAGNRSLTASDAIQVDPSAVPGSVSGTVNLAGAAQQQGVTVSLVDESTVAPAATDAAGAFSLVAAAGVYDVLIERNGYEDEVIAGVTITAATDTPLGLISLTAIDSGRRRRTRSLRQLPARRQPEPDRQRRRRHRQSLRPGYPSAQRLHRQCAGPLDSAKRALHRAG